jgi:hypothetical protein
MSYAQDSFETGGHLKPALTAVAIFAVVSILTLLVAGLPG